MAKLSVKRQILAALKEQWPLWAFVIPVFLLYMLSFGSLVSLACSTHNPSLISSAVKIEQIFTLNLQSARIITGNPNIYLVWCVR